MLQSQYWVVDVFTPTRFLGNPAGVVPHADELADDLFPSIAAEIHLSETAFVLRPSTPEADIRIRWFTPQVEVRMCGHATLAAAHVLRQTGQWADASKPLRIETLSGILQVEPDHIGGDEILWLCMPTPKLTRKPISPLHLAEHCGLEFGQLARGLPILHTQDRDVIVPVQDFQVLQGAQPNFRELGTFCAINQVRGVCLTTHKGVSAAVSLQSRFFAPSIGIDEDPVTGSVHGPLAVYAVLQDWVTLIEEEAVLQCLQTPANARVGVVVIRMRKRADGTFAVKVGGQCLTTMQGQVIVG